MDEIEVNNSKDLARLIFIDNIENKPISLQIAEGCGTNKELFYVCIELLTNGLSLLYGDINGKVNLSELSYEKLNYCKNKLEHVKIAFAITIVPCDTIDLEISLTTDNKHIEILPNDLPLSEYTFRIDNYPQHYIVRFDIIS